MALSVRSVEEGWLTARQQIRCAGCQRQTSVTAGTIFEGTRKPLRMWFQATWHVTNQKFGGSALGMQRALFGVRDVGFGTFISL